MGEWHKVRTVNPKGKKKGKGKVAKKKGGKKKSSSSRSHGKRGGRKRGSNPRGGHAKKRGGKKRGRNPLSLGGMKVDPIGPFRHGDVAFRIIGKLASAGAVMKWGDAPTAPTSTATMGGRWTVKNHIIGLVAGFVAGEIVARVLSPHRGQQVYDGAADLSISKAFWHELVQAIPGGATYFGRRPMGQIPANLIALAQPGDTLDDGKGNRFLVQVGNDGTKRLVPMMGLEKERALDGLQEARPLDGLEAARPLDGMQQRKLQAELRQAMGHLAPMDDEYAYDAASWRRGTNDPYAAQFTGG